MSSSVAKAYVQVIPSAKGIKGKLSSIFSPEAKSAGTSFGSTLIGTVKGLIAAAGLGKALGEALTAGADLQQSLGGIETLFKDSADIVIKNAEMAYKTAGMSANQYMEMVTGFSASLLQGLSGDTEKAAAVADMALKDMSDNANKMGTSMELIQNAYQGFAKQNYTMLDNLKLGYGGTKAEMERLLADAQKLTGIEYDISNLSDVYEAIHAIQEEMGITGATAFEAASTFSGSLASMKAAFSDLLANLATGRDITASLTAVGDTVFTFVQGNLFPMIGNIFTGLPAVLGSALSMAIRGLNLVADNAESIVQMGIDLVTGIGTAIISAVPYLAEAALNIVYSLGSALLNADWANIGNNTIAALRSSMDLAASEILGTDGNIVKSVLDAVTSGLPAILEGGVSIVVELANGVLEAIPGILETAGELMGQMLSAILNSLPQFLASGVELVAKLAEGLMNNGPTVFSTIGSILGKMVATIISHLPQLLEQGTALIASLISGAIACIPSIIHAAGELISSFIDAFGDINWGELGNNIIDGIAAGIKSGVGAIISAARQAARSALDAAKKFLGIASPSKVMRDQVGKFIPAGLAVGIEANTKPLTDAMHGLSDLTTGTMQVDLAKGGTAKVASVTNAGNAFSQITINVYASDNQDVEELAETVMQKIQIAINQREVCFV